MAKTLHVVQTLGVGAGVTRYLAISGSNLNSTTEAQMQITARLAGTFNGLRWKVITNTADFTTTVKFRKNGADGNMTVSAAAAQTGVFSDSSNSDAVADGDEFNWQITSGAGTGSCDSRSITCAFAATTNTVKYNTTDFDEYDGNTQAYFAGFNGSSGITTTEAQVKTVLEAAGTLKKAFIFVVSNARTTTTNYCVRINGADSAVTIAVTAGATGVFEDTSNTASVASGDFVNWSIVGGAEITKITTKHLSVSYETTDEYFNINSSGKNTTFSSGTTRYAFTGSGLGGLETTESNAQTTCPFAFTASNLGINVNSNAATTDGSCTLYQNGSGSALTVVVTALTTGYYEDTTHTVSVAAADTISYEVITGATGNIGVGSISIKGIQTIVVPSSNGAGGSSNFMMMGVG